MATLIILGNINQFTFANSILAASSKAQEIFNESLNSIFVIHSEQSHAKLNKETGWIEHLKEHGISRVGVVFYASQCLWQRRSYRLDCLRL